MEFSGLALIKLVDGLLFFAIGFRLSCLALRYDWGLLLFMCGGAVGGGGLALMVA